MRKKRAFTLIELLVVIAIISLLVSILLPSLKRAKDLTKRVVCGGNLRNVGVAVCMYANERRGKLPPPPNGQNCNAYWFYASTLGGFKNVGCLAGAELLHHQSGVFICPAWVGGGHSNSYGDHAHENCRWGDGASGFRPEHASLEWTHCRSHYRRRYDGNGDVIETSLRLGAQAYVGDVFMHPNHVILCHGDGVNVWYGDGHTEYKKNIDLEALGLIYDSGNFDNIWDIIEE